MKTLRTMIRPSAIGLALLGATLAFSGCATQESSDLKTSQTETVRPISFPDSKIGKNAEWVVEQINSGTDATASDWEGKLADSLTSEMSAKDLVHIINTEIRPMGPFTPTDFSAKSDSALTQLIDAEGRQIQFTLLLAPEGGLISGIHFTPVSS